MLVLCNFHIRSHPLNEHQQQIALIEEGKSGFTLWMERPGAHCVAMETSQWAISWNFVMSITTAKSFISIQRDIPFFVIKHHFEYTM